MDIRKIIKFGNSSYVVSLPKRWMEKNRLNKGGIVYVSENGNNELILSPDDKSAVPEEKELVINTNSKDLARIKREIFSAYLNNFTMIKIVGSNLKENSKKIREMIQQLMALEIMEQTSDKLITKDFLNMNEILISELVKKMDIVAKAIISDLKFSLDENNAENIAERDQNINKFYFVIIRAIRRELEYPGSIKKENANLLKLFDAWHVAHQIESIADEVKWAAELMSKTRVTPKEKQEVNEIISEIEGFYDKTMKMYYKNDKDFSYTISDTKNGIIDGSRKMYEAKHTPGLARICSYLESMTHKTHEILRRVYS